jgi:hypothetical protein
MTEEILVHRQLFEDALPPPRGGVKLLLSNSSENDFINGVVRLTASVGNTVVQARFPDELIPDAESLKEVTDKLLEVLAFLGGNADV